ncbi:esterase family protein [Microbulbifer agarilyticus]|uniref:alpha/beta hydrolase-fold protein n=1 Tax=Microbulbifer agarilyticus TaxID=260552 RepID=UPI001C97F44E|nr:alpha/beta hydrolase-fold protein [Microbulbifer agarilyticus]MBY6212322.1 esterase family protein [Microbulbifer agarilyticus]
MKSITFAVVAVLATATQICSAGSDHVVSVSVSVGAEMEDKFVSNGRLFLFLNENLEKEPRKDVWPVTPKRNNIFATNITGWNKGDSRTFGADTELQATTPWTLANVPEGTYKLQVLWDQDIEESQINAPGNLYSTVQAVEISGKTLLKVSLDQQVPAHKLVEHDHLKLMEIESQFLSEWWDRTMKLKASVLLPSSYYDDPARVYPLRINISGYGGRYTRVNYLLENEKFTDWWFGEDAPQVINVFLDSDGPFGDNYQLDSENSGPYGTALVEELIPAIERSFRTKEDPNYRYVDGCSTGGWVSLALQIFYPEQFGGAWSFSPDSVSFDHYQLVDLYKDDNLFVNEWGNLRPVARDIYGDPMVTVKDFIRYENVLGSSNTYLNSGFQFGAHTALYSPKGEDGLPAPMFDPNTGAINKQVVEAWKKYDLKLHLEENWSTLGPKLQGKIYVWMGDMDHFYLNPATRSMSEFLAKTSEPQSDAEFVFDAMEGHCTKFSNMKVLGMIQDKVDKLEAASP